MPYIPPDTLATIKRIDLYTYLKTYAPSALVRISGSVYRMRSHESLKISNGKWMWWSRGIGGRSALDYLIKVEGYSLSGTGRPASAPVSITSWVRTRATMWKKC